MKNMIKAMLLVLPAALAFFLGWKFGILVSFAVLLPEAGICCIIERISRQTQAARHNVWMAALSSAAIFAGAMVYNPASEPAGLGIAAALLAAVIHASLILILSSLISGKANQENR